LVNIFRRSGVIPAQGVELDHLHVENPEIVASPHPAMPISAPHIHPPKPFAFGHTAVGHICGFGIEDHSAGEEMPA